MKPAVWMLIALLGACTAPDRARIVVASDLDNAPFAFADPDGQPAGRDVDMMRELAVRADLELTWERMPFDVLLTTVESGQVDVVCATLGVTPERAERVAFTRPYFRTRIVAVARTGPGEPTELADLSGRPVAAGRGTTSERAVLRALPGARLVHEQKQERTTEQRLHTRAVDAAVMDGPAADAMVAGSAGALVVLEPPLAGEDYALALPLDRTNLVRALDRALAELEDEGWLASLDAEYGLGRR